ncbi:MAG TPA: galactonate dehydratase, partial [Planctomycetaceae bacterium]|nr:galactonate dehydratase [Planctomycetaceae bacterium]
MDNHSAALLLLNTVDNVAVARSYVPESTSVALNGHSLTTTAEIPAGHKVALSEIPEGTSIVKYGQTIGYAACAIHPGDWVHVHNVVAERPDQDYEFCTQIQHPAPPAEERTFMGYRRANGKAGTRNYIAVISTVNCSATAARYVAKELAETDLSAYPNIDGIVPLVHKSGCALQFNGEDHQQLNRT